MERKVLSFRKQLLIWLCLNLLFLLWLASPDISRAEGDSKSLNWERVDTPSDEGKVIVSPCEVSRIALGGDGKTFYALDVANGALYKSVDGGITWSDKIGTYLKDADANFPLWGIAVAPDEPKFIAVVSDDGTGMAPAAVWISVDGGKSWEDSNFALQPLLIGTIAISPGYGGGRDIAVGTRQPNDGAANGEVYVLSTRLGNVWSPQGFWGGDVLALEFSPNYAQDRTLVVVVADTNDVKLHLGFRDLTNNTTHWNAVTGYPVEVSEIPGASPNEAEVVTADLELPLDFNGENARNRKYFVSYDAPTSEVADVYRLDDTIVYRLRVPARGATKRISTIAYQGTTTQGKLLAGEVYGAVCEAKVAVYYSLNPLACPGVCWLTSEKPPTGGAGSTTCSAPGWGNAQLAWTPDGKKAYCGTSSALLPSAAEWPGGYLNKVPLDESAFSISRDDGVSWNQLSLIDTEITRLSDIAPSANGSVFYSASVNENENCAGFDSVWRSPNFDRKDEAIGDSWERVLCLPTTAKACATNQSDVALLRLPGDKADGSVVFWAARNSRKVVWSADFGDTWRGINPGVEVQDMVPETMSTLYVLDKDGFVQKIKRTTTGWIYEDKVPTCLDSGYSIATACTAMTPDNPQGHVIVGGKGTGNYDVAYSIDGATTFMVIPKALPFRGNTLVIASSGYKSDGTILAVVSGGSGIYTWGTYSGKELWEEWWWTGVVSLEISRNYDFYFSCPLTSWAPGAYVRWSKAGAGLAPNVDFGTEPGWGLRICGGLEVNQPVTVWLVDQRPYSPPVGCLWGYVDTLNWLGPTPIAPASLSPVDYDPVSGRAGQVVLQWEPRSLSTGYHLQLAEDKDFSVNLIEIGNPWQAPFSLYYPFEIETPSLVIPAGGGVVADRKGTQWIVSPLEMGRIYYWRVKVGEVATTDQIASPWSWAENFVVKAGLKVRTPSPGPMTLFPKNGDRDVPIQPVAFSWTGYQDATEYQFQLAEEASMTETLVDKLVVTTAYEWDEPLKYDQSYFWRVRAAQPVFSDWSSVSIFTTEKAPLPLPPPPAIVSLAPDWAWTVITFFGLMLISVFLLLFHLHRS